jgi:dihydroxy-acid dehydratase
MEDLHGIGGIPAILKYLLDNKMIDGDVMTVTGKSLEENLHSLPGLPQGQDIIHPLSSPIKATGHLQTLFGNLAPEGSVAKITGKEGLSFTGKARVFDGEENFIAALENGEFKVGEKVVGIIRYEGPKGSPGMREMCK